MTRASGVAVDLPEEWSLVQAPLPLGLGGPDIRGSGPVEDVVVALRAEMELVDELALDVAGRADTAGDARRTRRAPTIEVPVGPDERIAVLVERSGTLTWRFATTDSRDRGSAVTRDEVGAVVLDDLPAVPAALDDVGGAPSDRDRLAVVRVFRFPVEDHLLGAVWSLERSRAGLVAVAGDPATWREVAVDDGSLDVEGGRLLVLVHGTFGDTVGSFAPLGATDAGRRWLAAASDAYDSVVGFDHRTLSADLDRNATELLDLLAALRPAHVDLVAHGRGRFVCRRLVGQLRDRMTSGFEVDRVALLGTEHPSWPADLHELVDLATNRAASSVAALADTAAGAAPRVVAGLVGTGLSVLVRVVAAGTTDASAVPGLAALHAVRFQPRGERGSAVGSTTYLRLADGPSGQPRGSDRGGDERDDGHLHVLHDRTTLAALGAGLDLSVPDEESATTATRGGDIGGVPLGERRGSRRAPPQPADGRDAPDAPTVRTTHELGARMSARIALGDRVTLEVALAAGRLELDARGFVAGTAGVTVDESRPVVVDVWPRRHIELVDPGRLELAPPGPDDPPARRYVTVTATGVGPAAIDVVARQGSAPLATIRLEPVVTAAAVSGRPPTLEVSAIALGPVPLVRWLHRLTVWRNDTPTGPRLDAMLESPTLDQSRRFEGPVLRDDLARHVAGIRQRIERQAEWATTGDELVDEIRMLGIELFEGLLHEELRALLWQHREELDGLQIRTNDPHVPWEIVHLAPPGGRVPDGSWFLADLGVVRWLEDLTQPFPAPTLAADRVLVLAPTYPAGSGWELPAVDEEIAALERAFTAERVDASRGAVLASLGEPFDVLHYAGHGVAAPGDGLDAELVIGLERHGSSWARVTLPSMLVRRLRFDPARRPLVVLNACQVGQGQQRIGGLGGFARAFLDAGAAAVVAPLWSVGDRPAAVFVDHLYERLRAGDDISEASRAARRRARALDELSWLAYSVHANPEARLEGAAVGDAP